MEKNLSINFHVFKKLEDLNEVDAALVKEAVKAAGGSYSPYSDFHVGAAVRMENGDIVTGANQENAAFPSGLCAERTAMFAAGAGHKGQAMESIAITAFDNRGELTEKPAFPCGACRQVMAEYQKIGGKPMSVIIHASSSTYKFDKVEDLLPFIFDCI